MGMHNTFGQRGGDLFLSGLVSYSGGVPTLTHSSNKSFEGDVSVTDTGTGDMTIVVKSFKGPRGLAIPVVTTGTISVFASATSVSYSGEDLSVVVKIENDASAATDANIYFVIHAF